MISRYIDIARTHNFAVGTRHVLIMRVSKINQNVSRNSISINGKFHNTDCTLYELLFS